MANSPLIARVKNGRLVLDVPTDLPEGTEVELHEDSGVTLTDSQRSALHGELRTSFQQLEAGEGIDGDERDGPRLPPLPALSPCFCLSLAISNLALVRKRWLAILPHAPSVRRTCAPSPGDHSERRPHYDETASN